MGPTEEGVVLGVVFVGAVLANLPLLLLYCRYKTVRSVTDKFLPNLLLADFLSLTLLFPTILAHLVQGIPPQGVGCGLSNGLLAGLATASLIAAFEIAVERYLAVVTPLHYHKLLPSPTIHLTSLIGVLLSLGSGVMAFQDPTFSVFPGCNSQKGDKGDWVELFWPAYSLLHLTLTFALPVILMTFIYTRIWIEARRQHARMNKRCPPYFVPVPLDSSLGEKPKDGFFPILPRLGFMDRLRTTRIDRAARVGICTLGVTLIAWMPYFYVRAYSATQSLWVQFQPRSTVEEVGLGWEVPLLCASFHPFLAPIFYAYRYKRLRTQLLKSFCSKTTPPSHPPRKLVHNNLYHPIPKDKVVLTIDPSPSLADDPFDEGFRRLTPPPPKMLIEVHGRPEVSSPTQPSPSSANPSWDFVTGASPECSVCVYEPKGFLSSVGLWMTSRRWLRRRESVSSTASDLTLLSSQPPHLNL